MSQNRRTALILRLEPIPRRERGRIFFFFGSWTPQVHEPLCTPRSDRDSRKPRNPVGKCCGGNMSRSEHWETGVRRRRISMHMVKQCCEREIAQRCMLEMRAPTLIGSFETLGCGAPRCTRWRGKDLERRFVDLWGANLPY